MAKLVPKMKYRVRRRLLRYHAAWGIAVKMEGRKKDVNGPEERMWRRGSRG